MRHVLVLLVALLLAGCGSSASPTPSAASAPASASASAASGGPTPSPSSEPSLSASASASPAATDEPPATPSADAPSAEPPAASPSSAAADLPDTPVTAALDQMYNTTGDAFAAKDLGGVEPGDVTARWYVAGDRWAVHYDGLDAGATGPLCPGNSVQTDAGFEHVSNAPTEAGACEGFDATLASGPVGVRRCGAHVLYMTAIPADVRGILHASIETRYRTPGSVVGLTGTADPGDGEAPEIDLEALGCQAVPAGP